MSDDIVYGPEQLKNYVRTVCGALGSEPYERDLVADQLVEANLTGHDSHGVGMMPLYVASAKAGRLVVNGHATVASDNGAVLIVDGNRAFGQVTGFEATNMAIERAKETGVALMGLRNSFHIGRIGHWGEQCARAQMVSINFVNVAGHDPLVAPYGGGQARFATNPVCIAIPSGGDKPAALLDMATSIIALGKARVARNKGVPVPDGTLLDGDGRLTTDPEVMFTDPRQGALVAFGDHKGSGLAIMAELLGAALIGGKTIAPHHERDYSAINSMLSIVIDPQKTDGSLLHETESFLQYVKQSSNREGFDEVLAPGEPEQHHRNERADGVPVDPTTVDELRQAGLMAGVSEAELADLLG